MQDDYISTLNQEIYTDQNYKRKNITNNIPEQQY
jgi:hypothetical protein